MNLKLSLSVYENEYIWLSLKSLIVNSFLQKITLYNRKFLSSLDLYGKNDERVGTGAAASLISWKKD